MTLSTSFLPLLTLLVSQASVKTNIGVLRSYSLEPSPPGPKKFAWINGEWPCDTNKVIYVCEEGENPCGRNSRTSNNDRYAGRLIYINKALSGIQVASLHARSMIYSYM
jgi:hypothetical protein